MEDHNHYNHFADFELDVLKEVGSIGSGNAATALSRMLGKPIAMFIPKVNLVPFEQIAESVGGVEQVVVAIYLRVVGEVPGNIFFLLDMECAKRLLHGMLQKDLASAPQFSEMELSAIEEVGNILVGSYLSSLADFTHLRMSPTVPSVAIDMAGAILNYGLIQSGQMGAHALVIETKLIEGKAAVEGQFFFIPDPHAFDKVFQALGVSAE